MELLIQFVFRVYQFGFLGFIWRFIHNNRTNYTKNEVLSCLPIIERCWQHSRCHQDQGRFGTVGIEIEDEKVSSVLSALEGKSVDELVAEGNEKLAAVPAAGPASAGGAAAASGDAAAEEDKEEEAAEESDDDMGFGLFD